MADDKVPGAWKGDLKWAVALLFITILGLSGWSYGGWDFEPEGREDLGRLTNSTLLADEPTGFAPSGRITSPAALAALEDGQSVIVVRGVAYADPVLAEAVTQGQPIFMENGRATVNATATGILRGTGTVPAGLELIPPSEMRVLSLQESVAPAGGATRERATIETPHVFTFELLGVLLIAALIAAVVISIRDPEHDEEVR